MCNRALNSTSSSAMFAWKPALVQYKRVEIAVSVEVVWSLEHVMISDGEDNDGKIPKTALRVSPVRSLEILKFFAAKMEAQIPRMTFSTKK